MLSEHQDDKAPIEVCSGRYGPYVRHGKINATLPKDVAPEAVTLEEALEMIAAKAAKGGAGKAKTATSKAKTTTAKTATKKVAAKPAAKKPAAKKTTKK